MDRQEHAAFDVGGLVAECEQLLGRIIRVSSNPGELVLDPFAGSGSTLVVAKKLGRDYLGFELSENYAANIRRRLVGLLGGVVDGGGGATGG